ncbi:MAG: hypothetical protein SFV81_13385, partial [Pirellulaceae bacterium]|nr:hypothetical protein [Pirellulaceae bacterium]
MKNVNVRLSAIGGFLLLVSIAFALAQHDSRKRSRAADDIVKVPPQPAEPIAMDIGEIGWHQAPDKKSADKSQFDVVRANDDDQLYTDDPAPEPPDGESYDNPLRGSAQAYAVVTASGEGPANLSDAPPALPAAPSWLADSLPAVASQAPPPNKPTTGVQTATIPPLPSSAQLPSTSLPSNALPNSALPNNNAPKAAPTVNSGLPTFPMGGATGGGVTNGAATGGGTMAVQQPSATPPALPTLPSTTAPGLLPTADGAASYPKPAQNPPNASPRAFPNNGANPVGLPGANANSMSDTQRGAMTATSFPDQPASPPTGPARMNELPASLSGATNNLPQYDASASSSLPAYNNPVTNNPLPNGGPPNAGMPNTARATNSATSSAMREPPAQGNYGQSNPSGSFANASGRTPAALTSLVSNEPGSRYLDGSQNPIMLIQKRGPEEVRVGKKATFVITVRNAGNSTAHDVTVVDSVPLGMRFSEANPEVSPNAEGILTWKLGEMPAGDERTINLQMIPERQGELGSVATVHFTAQASLRTVATQPKLEIQIESQEESLIGDSQLIAVIVKNVGTGVARGVRLEADLPEQLRHESGDQHLEAIFPNDLAPNQSQRIELRSTAAMPGDATCVIRALTEDGTEAQQQVPVTILAPNLIAAIEGPRLRYLDRQATYKFKVQNNGTAQATNLKFVVRLPSGLRFNSSDNNLADYNPADHTVSLGLQELPVGQPAVFELTVLPVERGTQVLTLNATADLELSAEAKGQVVVEGLAELAFTIGQDNGTIEVGSSSTYTVQVTNIGNNPDKDVRLAVQLPAGAQVLKVDA